VLIPSREQKGFPPGFSRLGKFAACLKSPKDTLFDREGWE
jgi:hypothetical protein